MMDKRTVVEAKTVFQSSIDLDAKTRAQYYNNWAEHYEKDHALLGYRSPYLAVEFLNGNFQGSREDALVLDVACGTGWVAKLMRDLGFRHFVGVDGSEGMLAKARMTGLYQELKQTLLGSEPLPAQPDAYDIVMIAGAQDAGFVPVSACRELCCAAKPGGLVCMSRGHHTDVKSQEYTRDLEQEIQRMEVEGLWRQVGIHRTNIYMKNPHVDLQKDTEKTPAIPGTVYLYQKCQP